MGYRIRCECGHESHAPNIVALIERFTDDSGLLRCGGCAQAGATVRRSSSLQENGQTWDRHIRAVIPIKTQYKTYTPYVFLTSKKADDPPYGVHFNYYKDTRMEGGRLKHGHGPGGAPVLTREEMLQLLRRLGQISFLSADDLEAVAEDLRKATTPG